MFSVHLIPRTQLNELIIVYLYANQIIFNFLDSEHKFPIMSVPKVIITFQFYLCKLMFSVHLIPRTQLNELIIVYLYANQIIFNFLDSEHKFPIMSVPKVIVTFQFYLYKLMFSVHVIPRTQLNELIIVYLYANQIIFNFLDSEHKFPIMSVPKVIVTFQFYLYKLVFSVHLILRIQLNELIIMYLYANQIIFNFLDSEHKFPIMSVPKVIVTFQFYLCKLMFSVHLIPRTQLNELIIVYLYANQIIFNFLDSDPIFSIMSVPKVIVTFQFYLYKLVFSVHLIPRTQLNELIIVYLYANQIIFKSINCNGK